MSIQYALGDKNFEELANEWFFNIKDNVKISTVGAYSRVLKTHLIPYFGEMNYKDITPEIVKGFVSMQQEKGFNNRHVSNTFTLFRMITKYISEKYRCFNPAIGVKAPKCSRKSQKSEYTDKEREQVLNILLTDIDSTKAAALLVLHAGLHVGELCALKWEDVDLDNKTVSINKTLQRVSLDNDSKVYLMELDESKKRVVPIADYICEILSEYKAAPYTFFLSETRKPVEPRTIQYRLAALFRETGLEITFVKLREMFVGKCIEMGIDLASVSKMCGKSFFEIDTRKSSRDSSGNVRAVVMVGGN